MKNQRLSMPVTAACLLAVIWAGGMSTVSGQPGPDLSDQPLIDPPTTERSHDRGGRSGKPYADHGATPRFDEFGDDEDDLGEPYFGPPRPMTEHQLESAGLIVGRLYPDLRDRLSHLQQKDPDRYRRTLEYRFPRLRYLVELSERDHEMFELRMGDVELGRRSTALAEQVRAAEAAGDRDLQHRLRDELEHTVAQHFDVRQAIRQREIENLKHRLERMEDRWEDRDDDRDDLIEQRVSELAGPDW